MSYGFKAQRAFQWMMSFSSRLESFTRDNTVVRNYLEVVETVLGVTWCILHHVFRVQGVGDVQWAVLGVS